MNRFLLVDFTNLFFRGRHTASRAADLDDRLGMAIHTTLASINKCWRLLKGDHVIIALEGRSWRRDYYPAYKAQRHEARAALSPKEAEEDRAFWETLDQLKEFFINKTNCTILQHPNLEADDLIAGWIQNHPNDHHVIVSTDGDFAQLLAENVEQYNGVTGQIINLKGYFDERGKPVVDKKTKEVKGAPDPEWLLFEKCMRGDVSDNIFSAYPGVRTKGTKNKVGLLEAYADRHSKGFNWNNLMLQKFQHHDGTEHRVLDDYNLNRLLCDLTRQPDNVREQITHTVQAAAKPRNTPQVGLHFMKFCGRHNLTKISEQAQQYADILSARYPQSAQD